MEVTLFRPPGKPLWPVPHAATLPVVAEAARHKSKAADNVTSGRLNLPRKIVLHFANIRHLAVDFSRNSVPVISKTWRVLQQGGETLWSIERPHFSS